MFSVNIPNHFISTISHDNWKQGNGIVRNASDVKGGVRASTRRNYCFQESVIGNFACTFFGKGKWTLFRKVKCTS